MTIKPRTNAPVRNRELGTIALITAALWMTLFGLAAFAVDMGYSYTNRRGIKAATIAAVKAGMPAKNTSNALAMLTANGYTNGTNGVTATAQVVGVGSTDLQVDLSVPQPVFFGRIFGVGSRTISARSIGRVNSAGPALLALGGAGSQGLTITGNAAFVINGNVESAGPLTYSNGPTVGTTNGWVKSSLVAPTITTPTANTITGGSSLGAITPNPYAGVTTASFPTSPCTYGDLMSPYNIPFTNWSLGAGPVFGTGPAPSDTLAPGVYCSGGDLNVSSPGASMKINAVNVTFVARGVITIGANNGAHLSPAPGSPNNILAFTTSPVSCSAGQAINIGFNNFTFDGAVYAPFGCIRAGGMHLVLNVTPMVAYEISFSPDPSLPNWTIGSSGAAPWQMVE